MIPKVIHYCWFGGGQKNKLIQKCIKSWGKVCPDYTVIEWNEQNYDISSAPEYVRQAYAAKKWAYVADYVRLYVVFQHGGVYMDTDVELVRPLDPLLQNRAYFGFETVDTINTGLGFGAEKGHPILQEMMQQYEQRSFCFEDGKYLTCPLLDTAVFCKHGLKLNNEKQLLDGGILILPTDYLCPKSLLTEKITKTPNTLSIHHFNTSWFSEEQRKHHKQVVKEARRAERHSRWCSLPNRMMMRMLGEKRYAKFRDSIKSRIQRRSK